MVRALINQRVQFGVETVPGTSVAANRVLQCFDLTGGAKVDAKKYRATGRRFPSTVEVNKEWSEWSLEGNLDYNGALYPVSGVWGAATVSTPEGATSARQHLFEPPVTGAITPKTYTIEKGDSSIAEKVTYGLFTGFSYKGSRDDFTLSAPVIARNLQTGATMSSSPTLVALAPVMANQINLYLDTTDDDLGTTQLTSAFEFEFTYDSGFGSSWTINRSNASFNTHVDLEPSNTIKLVIEADSTGMGKYASLRAGDTLYLRIDALGPEIETDIHFSLVHDMAIKLSNVDQFSDNEGIYAIGYEGSIVEDATWGHAQQLTIVNSIAAL